MLCWSAQLFWGQWSVLGADHGGQCIQVFFSIKSGDRWSQSALSPNCLSSAFSWAHDEKHQVETWFLYRMGLHWCHSCLRWHAHASDNRSRNEQNHLAGILHPHCGNDCCFPCVAIEADISPLKRRWHHAQCNHWQDHQRDVECHGSPFHGHHWAPQHYKCFKSKNAAMRFEPTINLK